MWVWPGTVVVDVGGGDDNVMRVSRSKMCDTRGGNVAVSVGVAPCVSVPVVC